MKRRTNDRPRRESLCAELNEDDGIDPRVYFRKQERGDDRKTQQLCKQVFRILTLVLAGECGDAVLREIEILAVVPAPDSSRLLVNVGLVGAGDGHTEMQVLARLKTAQSFLRQQVAAAICRKRAPELAFRVLPREEGRA